MRALILLAWLLAALTPAGCGRDDPPPANSEPFTLDFPFLRQARPVVDPEAPSLEDVPEPIASLAGKPVRLTGFLMLPYKASDAIESIVVVEQAFNGCCMGEPPDWWDQVEVVRADGEMIALPPDLEWHNWGFELEVTVTGTLRLEIFMHEEYLIQLYRIEADVIDISEERPF